MRLLAPAKLNLYLRVGPRGGDGFHPLLTWMVTVGLFDTLVLRRSDAVGITLNCDDPSVPADRTNLVVRAIEAIVGTHQFEVGGVSVELRKAIPQAAGLGGGSSDAARAMLGMGRLLGMHWPIERLARAAAGVGSDVPFFLYGPSSVCTGRGEVVRPIEPPKPRWAMLVLPRMKLATVEVYRRFDEMSECLVEKRRASSPAKREVHAEQHALQEALPGATGSAEERALGSGERAGVGAHQPDWQEWSGLSAGALLPRLVNDLEPAAFSLRPELNELRGRIEAQVARPVRMSGSGSSLFTLFDAAAEARAAAEQVQRDLQTRALAVEVAPWIDDDLR